MWLWVESQPAREGEQTGLAKLNRSYECPANSSGAVASDPVAADKLMLRGPGPWLYCSIFHEKKNESDCNRLLGDRKGS